MEPACPCARCARRAETRRLHARWRTLAVRLADPALILAYAADKALDRGRGGPRELGEVLELDPAALAAEVARARAAGGKRPVPKASEGGPPARNPGARPPAAAPRNPGLEASADRSPPAHPLEDHPAPLPPVPEDREGLWLVVRVRERALPRGARVDLAALAREGEPRPFVLVGPLEEGPSALVNGLAAWIAEQEGRALAGLLLASGEREAVGAQTVSGRDLPAFAALLARAGVLCALGPLAPDSRVALHPLLRVLVVDLSRRRRLELSLEGPPDQPRLKGRLS